MLNVSSRDMAFSKQMGVVACVLCGILLVLGLDTAHVRTSTLTLETEHLPELLPHEHDAGEAVEDVGHHHILFSPEYIAPRDMWISSVSFDVVNAPDTVVHHGDLVDTSHHHQNCSNFPVAQMVQFVHDNMYLKTIAFPQGTAMHVKKGEKFRLLFMVHNPEPPVGPGGIYHDVYGVMTLTLLNPASSQGVKEIRYAPGHLDQIPCQIRLPDGSPSLSFTVPPRVKDFVFTATTTMADPARFTFAHPGVIVLVGGHIHGWQGGKELTVTKNNTPFLDFKTVVSKDDPYRYDSPYYPVHIPMNAGDTVVTSAIYDNPNEVERRGAMGIFDMYYYYEE
jgi:hypothetical protein